MLFSFMESAKLQIPSPANKNKLQNDDCISHPPARISELDHMQMKIKRYIEASITRPCISKEIISLSLGVWLLQHMA